MSAIYEYGELKKQDGIEQGIKEGRKEGRKEGMKEIIKNLYETGMNIKEISEKTKIEIKEVEKILN